MIAALYVERNGPYWNLPGVDPWDRERDARLYPGPWPVIAHPPCERWGRYATGGPSAKVKRRVGDDGGCFESALYAVRRWGGVLEHPADSKAWSKFYLPKPPRRGGWFRDIFGGWACCVDQGWYGHPAAKATWLYLCGTENPPELRWGRAPSRRRLEDGFHSSAERDAARRAGVAPVKRIGERESPNAVPVSRTARRTGVELQSRRARQLTPRGFRDLLISLSEATCPTRD